MTDPLRLDIPMTITQVARLVGMRPLALKRHLLKLHKMHGETLLVRAGPDATWMVTLASLRRVYPDFGKKFPSPEELSEVLREQTELRRDINAVAARLREFKKYVHARFQQLEGCTGSSTIDHPAHE